VSQHDSLVKAVVTFEVIDRRSIHIDDHAEEGNRDADNGRVRRTAARAAPATPHSYRRRAGRRHIKGQSDGVLSRRPDAKNWAAKEIVCHLRDTEEALAAFRRRRAETLDLFAKLEPGQWEKGGIHPVRGRFTIDAILSIMAWHDDNHLGQLMRALEGRV
jgi:hypothetical protein